MSDVDTLSAVKALARAREADNRIWSPVNHSRGHYRRARDRAVLDAVEAGLPLEQIADELGVLISDIERMAASARQPRSA
jgi:hypothetical protein